MTVVLAYLSFCHTKLRSVLFPKLSRLFSSLSNFFPHSPISFLIHFSLSHISTIENDFFSQNLECAKTRNSWWNSNFTKIDAFLSFDLSFFPIYNVHPVLCTSSGLLTEHEVFAPNFTNFTNISIASCKS
jgi:hypothetical protein